MTKFYPLWLLLACTSLAAAQPAATDEPEPLAVRLEPWPEISPYHYRLVFESSTPREVVTDRRLLALRVLPASGRRRFPCRHPQRQWRVDPTRIQELHAGGRYEEWIDLRMYCSGRALKALGSSATLEARYGFAGGGRRRWIARREEERRPPSRVELPAVAWTPPDDAVASPVVPIVNPATTRSERPTLRLGLRAKDESVRAYVRDDLFWLRVRGPLGEVECRPDRTLITPIVDFYARVTPRSGPRTHVDASAYCPEGTFSVPGLYSVTPAVDLIYDGQDVGVDAVTGTFEGAPAPVRILGGYVEQRPEDLVAVLGGGGEG